MVWSVPCVGLGVVWSSVLVGVMQCTSGRGAVY